jgi:hypothetical protein
MWSGICVGLKTLRREASGLRRVRSKQFDPLETSSFSMIKKANFLLVFGQNLSGLWLRLVWNLESVFVVQYICVLHFVYLCPRFLSQSNFHVYLYFVKGEIGRGRQRVTWKDMILFWGGDIFRLLCWREPHIPKILENGLIKWFLLENKNKF